MANRTSQKRGTDLIKRRLYETLEQNCLERGRLSTWRQWKINIPITSANPSLAVSETRFKAQSVLTFAKHTIVVISGLVSIILTTLPVLWLRSLAVHIVVVVIITLSAASRRFHSVGLAEETATGWADQDSRFLRFLLLVNDICKAVIAEDVSTLFNGIVLAF
jgi:hypothetical protein